MADIPPALARRSVERRQVSQKLRREERRERVLERMTDVFAKRGYQAATVDQLIAGAKISMGGFYKDFKGKEDCFVLVYDRVIDQLGERLRSVVPSDGGWATRAALSLRIVVEFAAEEPMAARVVLLEAQTGGKLALARYGSTRRQVARFLREGRKGATGAKDLPDSFEDATASGLAWLLQSRLSRERIEDAEDLWPPMAKMVLEPYVGPAQADRVVRQVA